MTAILFRFLRRTLVLVVVVAGAILGFRVWDSQRGPPLELWHTHAPHELSRDELRKADCSQTDRHQGPQCFFHGSSFV